METLTLREKNETVREAVRGRMASGGGRRLAVLPILAEVGRGGPAEGVVGPAIVYGHAGRAHGHADPVGLVVDGDHAKVGLEFVLQALLGADQLTVHHQACRGQQRWSEGRASDGHPPNRRVGYLFPGPTPG